MTWGSARGLGVSQKKVYMEYAASLSASFLSRFLSHLTEVEVVLYSVLWLFGPKILSSCVGVMPCPHVKAN